MIGPPLFSLLLILRETTLATSSVAKHFERMHEHCSVAEHGGRMHEHCSSLPHTASITLRTRPIKGGQYGVGELVATFFNSYA